MALNLVGQNIETDTGDSGTYTWDDIVALGSTQLITHTTASGKPFYRWKGDMLFKGTSTLTGYDLDAELLGTDSSNPGRIAAQDSAKIIFGRKRTISGKIYYDRGCSIQITRTSNWNAGANASEDSATGALSCGLTGSAEVNLYGCRINFTSANNITTGSWKRSAIVVKNAEYSLFDCPELVISGSDGILVICANASSISNNLFSNIYVDIGSETALFAGNTLKDAVIAAYRLDSYNELSGFDPAIQSGYTTVLSSLDLLDFLNSPNFDMSGMRVDKAPDGVGIYKKTFTHDLKITDGSGAVQNALVTYTGRTTDSDTSASDGSVAQFKLIATETDLASVDPQPGSYSTFATPLPLDDYSSYTREIRSYLHQAVSESLVVGQQVGSSSLPFEIRLTTDSGVTQTNTTTVAGYTGVSHTSTATTISGARTLAEAYDSRKLYWRTNGGLYPQLVGVTADWGAIDLVISGTLSGATKFRDGIKTSSGDITIASPSALTTNLETVSGTVILQSAGNYSGIVGAIGASAEVIVSGNTNLEGWIGNGATISSAVASTVTVTNASGWTAGANVTLQQPQASVTAANFANGARVQVAHRQVFTISAPAINTTTNAITLGTDSNGDAPAFSASPRTLVRFSKPAGSTMPTSTPQIRGNGLYYASLSGSNLTLSITDGGAAIDFSDDGDGTFTLIAETELANEVVSGGSGYSHALSLSSGALVRVKAVHWSSSGGNASCSEFNDFVFVWSATSGITIADVVDNTDPNSQDAIHEILVSISTLPLAGIINDATGAEISSVTLPSDGSTVAGLSFALEGTGLIQVNADDVDGILPVQALKLWGDYIRSTPEGIRLASATTFTATDIYNYKISNLEIDNISSVQLKLVGGVISSADGRDMIAPTSASVIPNAMSQGTGAIVPVGSGMSSEQDAKLTAVAAKTATLENGLTDEQLVIVLAIQSAIAAQAGDLTGIDAAIADLLTQAGDIETLATTIRNNQILRDKCIGLIAGVTASQKPPTADTPGFLTTSDGAVNQTLTLTDGVITASRNI